MRINPSQLTAIFSCTLAAFFSGASIATAQAPSKVVAHYRFEDGPGAGGTILDSGPNLLHGTSAGTLSYSTDRASLPATGNFSLDARGDMNFAQIGNNALLHQQGDFTVEMFFKADVPYDEFGSPLFSTMAVKLNSASEGSFLGGFEINNGHGGEIGGTVSFGGGNGVGVVSTGNTRDGQWHHVALVMDRNVSGATDQLRLYIDGALRSSTQGEWPDLSYGDQPLYIGAGNFLGAGSSYRRNFDGYIDEFRLTSSALTPAEFLSPATVPHHTSTWNSTTGNWSDPTRWSTPTAPGTFPNNGASTYDAVQHGGALTVDLPVTIQKLTMSGRSVLTATSNITFNEVLSVATPSSDTESEIRVMSLNGSGVIQANGGLSWSAGWPGIPFGFGVSEFTGVNTAVIDGRTLATDVINLSGTTTIHGGGVKRLVRRALNHGDGVNPSTANWTAGQMAFSNNAVFTNRAAAAFNNTHDGLMANNAGANFFINEGTFTKSGGTGTSNINIVFDNKSSGTVNVNSGRLSLNGGGLHSGGFVVATGGELAFGGGTHELNTGTSISGPGTLSQSGGTVRINDRLALNVSSVSLIGGTATANAEVTLSGALNLSAAGSQIINDVISQAINGAGAIRVSGGLNWSAGWLGIGFGLGVSEISGVNTAVIDGRTLATDVINLSGTTSIHGGGVKRLVRRALNHGDGVNPSTANWTAGQMAFSNNAVFTNRAAAAFNNTHDGLMANNAGANFFINEGTFTKSGGDGNTDIGVFFDNSGTLNVNSGTIRLIGSSAHTGSIVVAPGKTLRFVSGSHSLNTNASFSGAGSISIDSGFVTANANVTIVNPLTLKAPQSVSGANTTMTLNGPATINVTAPMVWSAQTDGAEQIGVSKIQGVNAAVVNGRTLATDAINITGGLALNGAGIKDLDRRALNHGDGVHPSLASWTEGILAISDAGVFTNKAGATFETNFNGLVQHRGGMASTFINEGTFTKSGGDGNTDIGVFFDNSGTLNVNSGTIRLLGSSAHTGSIVVAPGKTLRFVSGSHSLNTNASFSGAGSISIDSGFVTANANVTIVNPLTLKAPQSVSGANTTMTLNGPATINVTAPMVWSAQTDGAEQIGVSKIQGVNTAVVNGRTLATDAINITGGLALNGAGIKYLDRRALNHGDGVNPSVASWTEANVVIANNAVFTNKAGATFTTNFNGTFSHDPTDTTVPPGTFINEGVFTKNGGSGTTLLNPNLAFINSGTVNASSGNIAFNGGYTQTAGALVLNGGSVSRSTGTFTINDGKIQGAGTITGGVSSSGGAVTIEPGIGTTTGTLFITGDLTLTSGSKLSFDIGGTTAGTQHDKITEGGGSATSVAGVTLEASLSGPYFPAPADTFIVFDAATTAITGSFANAANGSRIASTDGKGTFKVNYGSGTAIAGNADKVILSNFQSTPTSLTLDDNQIVENAPPGTVVGLLSATDPNAAATFTFSLVAGAGDTGNGQFQVSGNQLQAKAGLDFETQTSYSVRVRVTNNGGGFLEQTFTIQVQDVPNPTALALSSNTFPENKQAGHVIGALSATNPPGGGDPVTFTVVSVDGSTAAPLAFTVSDSNLVTNKANFDFETAPGPFNVLVKATNLGGESVSQTFAVSVTDQGPTALALSTSSILEGKANAPVGDLSVTTIVPEGTAISTWELLAGAADNARFTLDGTTVKTAATALDFEDAPTRSIRVKATDANGESFTQSLSITVGDVAVTDITLSGTTVLENVPAGTVIANLGTVISPADPEATATFSIVSATPNDALSVTGNKLVTARPLLRSATPSLAVRLRAEHAGEGIEEDVSITVNANAGRLVVQNSQGTIITSLNVGDLALGTPATRTVTLRNPGPGHVFNVGIRNPIAPNNDASAASTALVTDDDLAPGESVAVEVGFIPQALGNRSSSIAFESDNAPDLNLVVTGLGRGAEISVRQPNGTELNDGSTVNFGSSPAGAISLPLTFTLTNVGVVTNLESLGVTLDGPDAAFFRLDTQGLRTGLVPGESSAFRVDFRPDSDRSYQAFLRIASSDLDENIFDVRILGRGASLTTVAQTAFLKGARSQFHGEFGSAVAVSGNTVVVGAPFVDGTAPPQGGSTRRAGRAFVYELNPATGEWRLTAELAAPVPSLDKFFGSAVAISGSWLVVGAKGDASGANGDLFDPSAPGSGAAFVFIRSGMTWSYFTRLKASNAQAGDQFGGSVAISSNRIVVGAENEGSAAKGVNGNQADNASQNSGAAYVFEFQSNWSQVAYLKASNTTFGNRFGGSVAISGDTIVVGSRDEDSTAPGINGSQSPFGASNSGAAYVFTPHPETLWAQQAYLKASNADTNDGFGTTVSIFGNTIAIGAPGESSGGIGVNGAQFNNASLGSGAVYVFERTGIIWTQQAYLKANNTSAGDQFGGAVAISGNRIVVGASRQENSYVGGLSAFLPSNSGALYLFERASGEWNQRAFLKASNSDFEDEFGTRVALDGDRFVASAPFEDSSGVGINVDGSDNRFTNSGAAYIFEITQPAVFVHDGPDTGNPKLTDNQAQAVDYGPTPLGISVRRSFTISNVRAAPLTVNSISAPPGYNVVNAPTEPIPAQGAAVFGVAINALTVGAKSGNVTINTNDSANPDFVFPVTGEVQTLAPGSLDPRFGTGGVARVDYATGDDRAYAMALLPDGRVAAGGRTGGSSFGTFALALLRSNGTPDPSFDGDGLVTLSPPGLLDPNEITAIAVQDGKIVVGGHATRGNLGQIPATGSFVLARYQMNGTLDATFGTDGLFVDSATEATIGGLAINGSGKILVAGSLIGNGSELIPYVRRLDQNGKPDAAFGNSLGIRELTHNAGEGALAEDLVQNSAGEIYVGGAMGTGSAVQMALWRTSESGTELLRSTFPLAAPASGLYELVSGVAIRHDGKPVVAGRGQAVYDIRGTGNGFFAGRMTSTPTLDGSFGNGGRVTTTLNAATSNERANTVAAQPDGKLIVAGSVDGKFAIVRYESNGALDTTFGTGGKVILNLGTDGSAYKVLLDAAGDIYVAGHAVTPGFAGQDFVVVKLIGSIEHEPAMTLRNGNTGSSPLITNGQTTAISFGTARVGGTTVSKSFRVENSGTAPLTINRVTVPAGFVFSVAASSPSIAAGGSGKLTVLMPAGTLGTFSGLVAIHSNDPTNGVLSFPITGQVKPNDPPIFGSFIAKTNQGERTTISVSKLISRVSDANGDPVSVTDFSPTSLFGASIKFEGTGSLIYNPPGTFFGTDQFSVTFSDGEAQIVGVVTVEVTQEPAFNPKNSPKLEVKPTGLAISFTGIPGKTYKIQRSTDVVNWTTIASATASSTGKVTHTDLSPPQPSAFYRITF